MQDLTRNLLSISGAVMKILRDPFLFWLDQLEGFVFWVFRVFFVHFIWV